MGEPSSIGRYEIRGLIGRGGMGVVYLGWDPVIGREVAVKCLDLKEFSDVQAKEIRERFRREAIAAGRLNHPYITTVFDVGEQEGEAFIAMELVKGSSLDIVLSKGTLLKLNDVARIISDISDALDHAHDQGIVHRDIKPGNILLPDTGGVKITDFGIARIEDSKMTREGAMLGSPSYMSPEQVLGKQVDRRSDVFSLGVILYIMLTGEKPFPGDSLATLSYKIVQEEPVPPSEKVGGLDSSVDDIISRALAKDPDLRFQRAGELAAAMKTTADRLGEFRGAETLVTNNSTAESTLPTVTVLPIDEDGKLSRLFKKVVTRIALVVFILAVFVGIVYVAREKISERWGKEDLSGAVATVSQPVDDYRPFTIVPRVYVLWRDAQAALSQGDKKQARHLLTELTLLAPEDAEAHLALGRLLNEEGDSRDALKSYRRALQLDPALRGDAEMINTLVSMLGTGRNNDASGILAELIGAPAEKSLLEAAAGENAAKSREALKTVVRIWQLKLEKDPGDVETRLDVARALYRLKRFPEAVEQYSAAIKKRPESASDAEIILNATELLDTRHHRVAATLLVESIGPPALETLRRVGRDRSQKMRKNAKVVLKAILEAQKDAEPENFAAPMELAFIYDEEGNIDAAVSYVGIALDRNGSLDKDPKVMTLLIKALERNDADEAKELIVSKMGKMAVKPLIPAMAGDNRDLRWNAAEILEKLGEGNRIDNIALWAKDLVDPETRCGEKKEAAKNIAAAKNEKAVNILEKALNDRNVRRCGLNTFKKYLEDARDGDN